MEDEIEDIVGDVKLTDSQKSVATSNVYSMDFTDSSSDKNHSSGMDTYVLEQYDSEDSESYIPVHKDVTTINLRDNRKNKDMQCDTVDMINKAASTSVKNCSVVSQEIYTQTSKTIIELAQAEDNKQTLETQTSFVSITKHKTYEYRIELSNVNQLVTNNYETVLSNALEEESSKFQGSDLEIIKSEDNITAVSSDDRIINLLDAESKDNILSYERNEIGSDFEESSDSDIEQDSLMEKDDHNHHSEVGSDEEARKTADSEIEDLYNKLTGNGELNPTDRDLSKRCRALTPLTEESTKRDSLVDITSESKQVENSIEDSDKDVLFTNFSGGKVKMLPREENREFKLPPIQNSSCPNSPHLNFLFSVHPSNKLNKAGTLPCLYEASDRGTDRWEIKTKSLASGESAFIGGGSDPARNNGSIHLPPIHIEGYVVNSKITKSGSKSTAIVNRTSTEIDEDISITDKIKELKMSKSAKSHTPSKYKMSESRSCSPCSRESHDGEAERGCEVLCTELLRRLRSSSWFEVSDTLLEIPKILDKFWSVIAEQRIADLIRQVLGPYHNLLKPYMFQRVSAQIESPRTQVARSACHALACVLKNTNYTKKPDFYEAVTLLLTKTGSFSRPVRRAANMALDAVVCGVELSHAVTALCVHGVDHKSPLVRCAAARLLVVSCALCAGGRGLLRARPPSAAAARRHTLRSLAALLDDKNTDARKYAERLYAMLRPLANFEAYYLTDVDVELASRQMKKYDRVLACAPKDAR